MAYCYIQLTANSKAKNKRNNQKKHKCIALIDRYGTSSFSDDR